MKLSLKRFGAFAATVSMALSGAIAAAPHAGAFTTSKGFNVEVNAGGFAHSCSARVALSMNVLAVGNGKCTTYTYKNGSIIPVITESFSNLSIDYVYKKADGKQFKSAKNKATLSASGGVTTSATMQGQFVNATVKINNTDVVTVSTNKALNTLKVSVASNETGATTTSNFATGAKDTATTKRTLSASSHLLPYPNFWNNTQLLCSAGPLVNVSAEVSKASCPKGSKLIVAQTGTYYRDITSPTTILAVLNS